MFNDPGLITLTAVTLLAAVVNGGLGYGFSSITVPVALIFYANRILNPALVRVIPLLAGLIFGVAVGSQLLSRANPEWLKLFTYAVVLPLILLQAAGVRRPIRSARLFGVPVGAGVGILHSLTTISGPPLALLFNNQGYVKEEFRASLGLIRVAESSLTAIAYYWLGLYSTSSTQILASILPSVAIGIPLGAYLIRHMPVETFRRIC